MPHDKTTTSTATTGLDFMTAMGCNRAERRRLAKVNGISKILGSNKPFVTSKE